ADVAHDVGELQRLAEVDRVLPRARIGVAEDLDAAEPHGRGYAIAVRLEVLGRLVADALEVHLAAVDDRLQRGARNRIGGDGGLELAGDRMDRRGAALEAARDVLAPAGEAGPLGGRITAEI